MGGTNVPITAKDGIVLHGSGTTGCHGAVERRGREHGWAYELGYLSRGDSWLRTPDGTRLVWHHARSVWMELFDSGVRVPVPVILRPISLVLAAMRADCRL